MEADIVRAASAAGYYNDDAEKFNEAATQAGEYLSKRVAAAPELGKRRQNRRKRRALRDELISDCMTNAGVPENTWKDWLKAILGFGLIALPTGPWAIVISAIVWAVDYWLLQT